MSDLTGHFQCRISTKTRRIMQRLARRRNERNLTALVHNLIHEEAERLFGDRSAQPREDGASAAR